MVFDRAGSYMTPKNREILLRYIEHFDLLDTHLRNCDCHGVAQIFHKYSVISDEVRPFFQKEGIYKACIGNTNMHNNSIMFRRSLHGKKDANFTLLQMVNNYLQPTANHLYYISDQYQTNSADKC